MPLTPEVVERVTSTRENKNDRILAFRTNAMMSPKTTEWARGEFECSATDVIRAVLPGTRYLIPGMCYLYLSAVLE